VVVSSNKLKKGTEQKEERYRSLRKNEEGVPGFNEVQCHGRERQTSPVDFQRRERVVGGGDSQGTPLQVAGTGGVAEGGVREKENRMKSAAGVSGEAINVNPRTKIR